MSKMSKAERWTLDGLNEYASLHWQGKDVPNHSPVSPRFWFAGLAREIGPSAFATEVWQRELTPGAKRLARSVFGKVATVREP